MPNTPVRNLRIEDPFWDQICATAEAAGLTASEWMRRSLAEALDPKAVQ